MAKTETPSPRQCPVCREWFIPATHNQKYDVDTCQRSAAMSRYRRKKAAQRAAMVSASGEADDRIICVCCKQERKEVNAQGLCLACRIEAIGVASAAHKVSTMDESGYDYGDKAWTRFIPAEKVQQ